MLDVILQVLGFLIGFVGVMGFVFWVLLRNVWIIAPLLVNDPKNPDKFFCFTKAKPGELKVVVRGDTVVGYIMNMPEKSLLRDKTDRTLTVNNEAFADIVDEKTDTALEDLFYWCSPFIRSWSERVYKRTGLVFVGVPPWQTLGTRTFRSAHLSEDRTKVLYYEGVSDHMRVREFARPFIAEDLETMENLKVTIGVEITFETINGFKQWHAVDRFEIRLDNIVPSHTQAFVKTHKLEETLTAKEETARAIEEYLIGTRDGTKPGVLSEIIGSYGLRAKKAHVFLIDPKLSDEERQALTATWRAQKRKEARAFDAAADADYLAKTSAPLKDNEGLVRVEVAKAAAQGKGVTTVIFEGGSHHNTDPTALAELQRIRNKGNDK